MSCPEESTIISVCDAVLTKAGVDLEVGIQFPFCWPRIRDMSCTRAVSY